MNAIYDIEDVKYEVENAVQGDVVEKDGKVVFKLSTRVVKLDLTKCSECPTVFNFRKPIKSGCNPDKCIAENRRTCDTCKFQLFANEVEFKAELLFAQWETKDTDKRFIATYKIS